MNHKLLILFLFLLGFTSCIPVKEIKYLQPDDDLELNEYGYISSVKEEYRLQPDDVILITIISKDPNVGKLFGNALTEGALNAAGENVFYIKGIDVKADGYIELPTIGRVYVQGLSLDEVKEALEKELYKTYRPDVIFLKTQLNGITYTIQGEVGRPNTYVVYRNQLNVLEAIAKAGDLKTIADRRNVKLIRQYPEGKRIIHLDLTSETLLNSPYFYLQPNDHIIVDPKKQKTLGTGTNALGTLATTLSLASSIFALYFTINKL